MSTQTPIAPTLQNPLTVEYDLTDTLELYKKDIFLNLNCHAIGTIQSFDASNQTASATVNYQRTFYQTNPDTAVYESYLKPFPLLIECPVICLGGGTASLTFPITVGDECLIFFNDRNLDNWFVGNGGGAVATARLHAFSDAVILVGLRNQTRSISNYSTTHAVLQNGSAQVGVSSTKINITNGTSLKTVLNNLINAIESATYGGNGIDSTTMLEAVKTAIGNLLE